MADEHPGQGPDLPDPGVRPTRREFLKAAGIGAAACAAASEQGALHAAGKRPNIIFVFADQLRYQSVGYSGDEKAKTPNIDALAAEGVSFRNTVSSMPVCAAYRATLMTGKYTTSTGMVINELRMNTNHRCFGHVLTGGGYETGYVGKWHLYANQLGHHLDPRNSFVPPGPHRLGFDGYWAGYGFHHVYHGAYYHTDSPKKIFYGKNVYEPDAQTDLAVDFMRKAAKGKKPFALFLSYGTPHDPWNPGNVPERFRRMFEGVEFPDPPNYKPQNDKYADNWGRLNPKARKQLAAWRRVYYAMTANLDWNIGRLLDAVKGMGIAEDTIVVFTSDHGEMFGAQGRRAKNTFYEEAARIPFLVRWPGSIPAGTVSHACMSNVDFMPTVLGLAGLEIPGEVEGMSLAKAALGKPGPEPEAAFMQNTGACAAWRDGHEWRALRDKRYTYAIYRRDKAELLFDNRDDPYQMKNLASDPAQAATMKRFREMLADKMSGLKDEFRKCTWYRENWTKNRIILRGAKG